jgi:hypothetical protein
MRRVEKLRYGRKQALAELLFPGYLFIRLDRVNDNWHPIRSTRGVNRIVRFNGDPLPVQDEVIEQIRARLEGAAAQESYLNPGERVQITEGAFARLSFSDTGSQISMNPKDLMFLGFCLAGPKSDTSGTCSFRRSVSERRSDSSRDL